MVDGHVDEQRVGHLLPEAREVRRLGEDRTHRPDRAEPADHGLERGDLRVPAPGLADHEQLAGDLGRGGQREGLGDRRRDRLLAEHRKSGEEGRRGDGVMRLGNGDIDDGVRGGASGDLHGVGPDQDRRPVCVGRRLRGRQVQVDHAGENHVARPRDGLQPGTAHAPGSDHDQAQRSISADRPEPGPHPSGPVRPANSSPVAWRRSAGRLRSDRSLTAHSTAFAMTRRTSGWWYVGYSWSPGRK